MTETQYFWENMMIRHQVLCHSFSHGATEKSELPGGGHFVAASEWNGQGAEGTSPESSQDTSENPNGKSWKNHEIFEWFRMV